MRNFSMTKTVAFIALTGAMGFVSMPAQAQSTESVLGALIGGSAGSVIGGELDNKGSKQEGQIIGAIAGGTLGYVIGDSIDDDNDKDRELRQRYDSRSGQYYKQDGRAYRRYQDPQHGYVSIPVRGNDRYYHADGRKKIKTHKRKAKFKNGHDNRYR